MEKKAITEEMIKNAFYSVINEETSKVKRDEFSRVQYKMEELENSLNETLKEFRKLEDCIPGGLKTITNGRISKIGSNLNSTKSLISQLKHKIREHKRNLYNQKVEENKK
jgi:septal ring factor EnvC (AmiA/AmiB activator)